MIKNLLMFALLVCFAAPAGAEGIRYYPDPVYKKLSDDDHHPMDEIMTLANDGDVRAQFILGDMYQKGKGGLAKSADEARRWFEQAATHGYAYAFVRLAAMAKRENSPVEAWQWYTLAIDNLEYGDEQHYAIKARKALVEKAELTEEDLGQGRKAVNAWEEARSEKLRVEKKALRLKREQELAEKKNSKTPEEGKKDDQN